MNIGSAENHRSRENASLVYPVYSRRSKGLSVGINLFPDKKFCSFDCPYCEVFPFGNDSAFDICAMEKDLVSTLADAEKRNIEVKDICFSGNGEPSLSPYFPAALEKVLSIRGKFALDAAVVLITNGTGLLHPPIFDLLAEKAMAGLDVWLKIDAATEGWFKKIDRPKNINFNVLLERIKNFAGFAPFIAQTMICSVNGLVPPPEEERAWIELIAEISRPGKLRYVQIYGKARPAPEDPLAEAVDVSVLENRAAALMSAMAADGSRSVPVEVFK